MIVLKIPLRVITMLSTITLLSTATVFAQAPPSSAPQNNPAIPNTNNPAMVNPNDPAGVNSNFPGSSGSLASSKKPSDSNLGDPNSLTGTLTNSGAAGTNSGSIFPPTTGQ